MDRAYNPRVKTLRYNMDRAYNPRVKTLRYNMDRAYGTSSCFFTPYLYFTLKAS